MRGAGRISISISDSSIRPLALPTTEWRISPLKGYKWKPYIVEEKRSMEGELDISLAERT